MFMGNRKRKKDDYLSNMWSFYTWKTSESEGDTWKHAIPWDRKHMTSCEKKRDEI